MLTHGPSRNPGHASIVIRGIGGSVALNDVLHLVHCLPELKLLWRTMMRLRLRRQRRRLRRLLLVIPSLATLHEDLFAQTAMVLICVGSSRCRGLLRPPASFRGSSLLSHVNCCNGSGNGLSDATNSSSIVAERSSFSILSSTAEPEPAYRCCYHACRLEHAQPQPLRCCQCRQ